MKKEKKMLTFLEWHREGFNTFFSLLKIKTEQQHVFRRILFAVVEIRPLIFLMRTPDHAC